MSALKNAVKLHDRLFAERGYRPIQAFERGPTYSDGGRKFIIFDRVMGGSLRCFLGNGPTSADGTQFEVEGGSPWWPTGPGESAVRAVPPAIAFLAEVGFSFLDDPLRLMPAEWRERHGIIIRDHRPRELRFSAPSGMEPNRVILACVRTHPTLRGQPALRVREILGRKLSIPPVGESLAFALEIKRQCEAEGLIVSIAG